MRTDSKLIQKFKRVTQNLHDIVFDIHRSSFLPNLQVCHLLAWERYTWRAWCVLVNHLAFKEEQWHTFTQLQVHLQAHIHLLQISTSCLTDHVTISPPVSLLPIVVTCLCKWNYESLGTNSEGNRTLLVNHTLPGFHVNQLEPLSVDKGDAISVTFVTEDVPNRVGTDHLFMIEGSWFGNFTIRC